MMSSDEPKTSMRNVPVEKNGDKHRTAFNKLFMMYQIKQWEAKEGRKKMREDPKQPQLKE